MQKLAYSFYPMNLVQSSIISGGLATILPTGKATKRAPVGGQVKLLNFGVSDTVSKTLCGGESVFKQSHNIFSKSSPWAAEWSKNGGAALDRREESGGPWACPRKFLEIHHIECRKMPHYE